MLARLEILPLRLHLRVQLQLRVALGIFEAIFLEIRNQVGEQQCVYALALIFRLDSHKQKVDRVGHVEIHGAHQMPPSERQHSPMRLLQRPRQRRQSHAHTDNLVVGVFYHTEQVEAQQAQINLHIIVNLTVGQFGKLKQLGISLVDKVE